jgi:hypothetical protein
MPIATPSLTRTQKRLLADLDKIMSVAGLDYWNTLDQPHYHQHRTTILQVVTREIVRGTVVSHYTRIDELLGSKICDYMFHGRSSIRLWKTKKFERFNYFILEKMSLVEKLAFVKDVYNVRRAIASDIESINAIRNAVAHAFYPENLRAYRMKRHSPSGRLQGPLYKGADIFTFDGFDRFLSDAQKVAQFMITIRQKKSKGVAIPSSSSSDVS